MVTVTWRRENGDYSPVSVSVGEGHAAATRTFNSPHGIGQWLLDHVTILIFAFKGAIGDF